MAKIENTLPPILTGGTSIHNNLSGLNDGEYIHLTATNPELIKRIPQQLVASYLGITPETLSRIKNKLAKGATKT